MNARTLHLWRTLWYSLIVPGVVTILVPVVLYQLDPDPSPWAVMSWRWLGLVPLGLGYALYAWCAFEFATRGRGTPSPFDPPQQLVTNGAYRWTRNPIYVGMVAILLGEQLLFPTWYGIKYFAGALVVMHLIVVWWEEPALRRRYGDAYESYCARVGRWFMV